MLTRKDYSETEERFYKILLRSLGSEIYLYCVTGSLSRNEIIPGWSDIDVLLVIKDYRKETFECINGALIAENSKIKIGITIFSIEEFNHNYLKDSKTYLSMKFIKDGYYKPRIISSEIKLLKEDKILRKYIDISEFSRFSHEIKRELLKETNYDEKKVYKLVITSLKILLNQTGVVTLGYQDTLRKAVEHLPNFKVSLFGPEIILSDPKNKIKRYSMYLDFLEWVRKNENLIFI